MIPLELNLIIPTLIVHELEFRKMLNTRLKLPKDICYNSLTISAKKLWHMPMQ